MEGKYTEPNFAASALITIDTQNDFTLPGAVAEIRGTIGVVPRMRNSLNVCRAYGLPIIHVVRLYKEDGSNADLCRREAIESGKRIVQSGTLADPGTEGGGAMTPPFVVWAAVLRWNRPA